MRHRTRLLPLAGLAALIMNFAAPAAAQTEPDPLAALARIEAMATCPEARARHEADDQKIVNDAGAALQQEGFAALNRHVEALLRVAGRAPSCYPEIEERDSEIILRTAELSEFLILAAVLGGTKHKNVVQAPNTYVDAMLFLGLHFNEVRRYDEALAWLDRGLARQPRFWPLILERAASLMALDRDADAAASLRTALDDPNMSVTFDRARFTRVLGVALIELNRLDEAEGALNESIRLQPDNPGARRELAYIAQLRAGAPPTDLQMSVPENPPEEQKK